MEINIFQSHIEVYPYKQGDCLKIEKLMSKWDSVTHSYIPMGYYIQDDILYLPRGVSGSLLEKLFETEPIVNPKADPFLRIKKGSANLKPKSRMQSDGIDFLLGEGNFGYTQWYSQLGLNLQTGDGKTYSTITAILKLKMRAIIITHQEKLKEQWIDTLENMTSFPMENFYNIDGSDKIDAILNGDDDYEIYCVNHQTLASYAKDHGWNKIRELFKKIKVGIKVVDEAHKFFKNTLMIDYFSNCYKSIYLTATFGRSDQKEVYIYNRAFQSLARFGEETLNYEEKRKHINFIGVYFKSKPLYGMEPRVRTKHGFSSYKYIDYEFEDEPYHTLLHLYYKLLDKCLEEEGKLLVLTPKVESVEYIANITKDYTGIETSVIHGKRTKEQNRDAKEAKIISSTIKSVGEGADIKGLRIIILLEPIGSKQLMDQVIGRLREYSEDLDTYVFYPMDLSITDIMRMYKNVFPSISKKCKSIKYIRMD